MGRPRKPTFGSMFIVLWLGVGLEVLPGCSFVITETTPDEYDLSLKRPPICDNGDAFYLVDAGLTLGAMALAVVLATKPVPGPAFETQADKWESTGIMAAPAVLFGASAVWGRLNKQRCGVHWAAYRDWQAEMRSGLGFSPLVLGSPDDEAGRMPAKVDVAPSPYAGRLPGVRGYGKVRWGDTRAGVRRVYPRAQRTVDGNLSAVGPDIGGNPTVLLFIFTHDRLSVVVIHFKQTFFTSGSYVRRFEEIHQLVEKKYGPPDELGVRWYEQQQLGEEVGDAIAIGRARLVGLWNGESTRIEHDLSGEGFRLYHFLRFVSVAMEPEYRREQDEKALEGL